MNGIDASGPGRDESPGAGSSLLSDNSCMFQLLFEQSADAIWLLDPQTGLLVDGNAAAVELMGAGTRENLLAARPEDLLAHVQPDGTRGGGKIAQVIALVEERGRQRFEGLARRFDGREVSLEVLWMPIRAGGRGLQVVVLRDITERKKGERELLELNQALKRRVAERTAALATTEQALRESEEKFRALFEGSSQGVVLHDENQILEANPAAVRILGCQSQRELLGKHPNETTPPFQPNGESSAVLAGKYIEECMANGSARFERISCTPQGVPVPLEVALTRIQWSGRQIIQAFITDITERTRAQTALAESEARFSAAFQASPVFISVMRMSDEKYVLVNDALVGWLGRPREEVLGRTSAQLAMWDSLAERDLIWQELRTLGSIRQRECRWLNRRGELFTVLLSAERITVDNQPHVLSLVQDISQRKNAELEMLRALAREKELSQLKGNFVSMVSHEFRTPLGIIQSSAELLRDFYQKMQPGEREEQLVSIARNTGRMAGMMEEILILSRLDAGKLQVQPVALDLNAFCRRVVDEVLSATNRRCRIDMSLHSVLPEAEADERLLGYIFTNLLSNAVKYSDRGTTVHFVIVRDGSDAVWTIRDQGIGISEEDQQHLFKAFHRGSNVGTRPGTGLGLLLVKRCAELHGGRLLLNSKIGEGTTVTVRLPVFGMNQEK
ncbi:MAG TPA: PAS domain-containing sensor histidine kinase [Verrucomicrobiae bacterium]|nr:PAS domain-containing sensor histidine kinase [Verrucomicrobiae bacterium]